MGIELDIDDVAAAHPKALAELEALRADAERYRWLREHWDYTVYEKDGYGGSQLKIMEDLDAAIDAALKALAAEIDAALPPPPTNGKG